jgi:hypothetical protein
MLGFRVTLYRSVDNNHSGNIVTVLETLKPFSKQCNRSGDSVTVLETV